MNLAIAATVFPLIFIGELPDKTMFASLLLSTRGRPGAVWSGAALAFAIHVVLATTAGTVAVTLLPHRALEAVVAVLFLAGAVLMILEIRRSHPSAPSPKAAPGPRAPLGRTAMTAFLVVFVAEWGDLTQMLTANLAAHYHAPLAVGTGAVLALWAVAAIAVTSGKWLTRLIDATMIRAGAAVLLAGLAAYSGWAAIA